MDKKGKKIIRGIGAAAVAAVLLCGAGLYRYVSNVPKVTPKQWVADAASGQSYFLEELADVKCRGDYTGKLQIIDTDIEDAVIKGENSNILDTGTHAGYIRLSASARGDHSEYGEEAELYVYTALGSEEQEDLAGKLASLYKLTDEDIRKNWLKDEKAEAQHAIVTVSLSGYSTDDCQIVPFYYIEYSLSDGTAKKLAVNTCAVLHGDEAELISCTPKKDEVMSDGNCTVDVMQNVLESCDNKPLGIPQEHTWVRLEHGICAVFSPESYTEGRMTEQTAKLHSIEYAADALKLAAGNE